MHSSSTLKNASNGLFPVCVPSLTTLSSSDNLLISSTLNHFDCSLLLFSTSSMPASVDSKGALWYVSAWWLINSLAPVFPSSIQEVDDQYRCFKSNNVWILNRLLCDAVTLLHYLCGTFQVFDSLISKLSFFSLPSQHLVVGEAVFNLLHHIQSHHHPAVCLFPVILKSGEQILFIHGFQ